MQRGSEINHGAQGFILPYVLVSVTALALIAAAAFAVLSRASETMIALDEAVQIDFAMVSGEAGATFAFLTASPANGGLALSPVVTQSGLEAPNSDAGRQTSPANGAFATILRAEDVVPDAFWASNGAARRMRTGQLPVLISYRDSAGLFPITSASLRDVGRFLRVMGLRADQAENMAAKILDYQDSDVVRRPGGAEQADYRLFGLRPPPNSAFRAAEELGQVLQLFDVAPPLFWQEILDIVSVEGGGLSKWSAPPRLAPLLDARASDPGGLDSLSATVNLPSQRARFLLTVRGKTRVYQRALDVRRSDLLSQTPFYRYWIYERSQPPVPTNVEEERVTPEIFPLLQRRPE